MPELYVVAPLQFEHLRIFHPTKNPQSSGFLKWNRSGKSAAPIGISSNSWSVIAAKLPGRTDLAIKNYWNSTLKKRFPRAARSRRLRHRRTGSTSSDDRASPELALVVYDEESISPTALVEYNEEDSATTAPDLQLVVYNEASATAGSPSSHAAANEEPIAAVPISGPMRMEPRTPPPPADETSEEMDADFGPMSPVPLGLMVMEPDLPGIAMGLPHIAGFDDIDIFLSYFDH